LTAQTEIHTATRYTLRRLPNASTCRAQPIGFQRPGPNDHTAHYQRHRLSYETYLLFKKQALVSSASLHILLSSSECTAIHRGKMFYAA